MQDIGINEDAAMPASIASIETSDLLDTANHALNAQDTADTLGYLKSRVDGKRALKGKIVTNGAAGFTHPVGGVGVGWTATLTVDYVRVSFTVGKANDDYVVLALMKENNGSEIIQYFGETTAKVDFTFKEETAGAMGLINPSATGVTFCFKIEDMP
jgi:hypothetical protein